MTLDEPAFTALPLMPGALFAPQPNQPRPSYYAHGNLP